MFALKVLLLLGFALLYVTGLLVIAVRPLPELSHFARAWATALLGLALVPVGWTILFAVAGALSLDATSFHSTGTGTLGGALTAHIAGAFAAPHLLPRPQAPAWRALPSSWRDPRPWLGWGLGRYDRCRRGRRRGLSACRRRPQPPSLHHARRRTRRWACRRRAWRSRRRAGRNCRTCRLAAFRAACRLRVGRWGWACLACRRPAWTPFAWRNHGWLPVASPSARRAAWPARKTFTQVFAIQRAADSVRAGAKRGATPTRFGTGQRGPAKVAGSGSASPPRPSQRAAPAGEGDARASSATGRGGSSDGTAPSRRSVDGPNTHRTPSTGGGASSRDDGLAADASARRHTSPPAKPKPPRAEPTPGGNPPSGTRSGNPQSGGRGKASPPPPRANPPRGPRGGSGGAASPARQTGSGGKTSRPPRTEGGGETSRTPRAKGARGAESPRARKG
jgi:hypothetical protein